MNTGWNVDLLSLVVVVVVVVGCLLEIAAWDSRLVYSAVCSHGYAT